MIDLHSQAIDFIREAMAQRTAENTADAEQVAGFLIGLVEGMADSVSAHWPG
ncbi:hypothetical protein [Veronia nyctiphanis]|uniref:hypothetical protein n=1 Tax=Veronia nyctiphanis TaxID=1278244 RepID=UPI001375DC7E|nr:hypothetical protein [Veronia nyctiphanis]